MAVNVLSNPK